jgi:hypothetical protein
VRKKIPTITRPDPAYAASLRPEVEEGLAPGFGLAFAPAPNPEQKTAAATAEKTIFLCNLCMRTSMIALSVRRRLGASLESMASGVQFIMRMLAVMRGKVRVFSRVTACIMWGFRTGGLVG